MHNKSYQLPDFNFFKPKKVKKISEKINNELEDIIFTYTDSKLDRAIEKLKSNENLLRSDYKILFYNLSMLDSEDNKHLINRLFHKSEVYFNKPGNYLYHYKALLSSFYNIYNNNILELMKLITNNNKNWKEDMSYIRHVIDTNNTIKNLLTTVLQEIKNCNSKDDLREFKNKLLIKNNNNFLEYIFLKYIEKNLDTTNGRTEFIMYILNEYISWENQKKVFEKFLLLNKDLFFDDLSPQANIWFELISDKMGNPYGLSGAKWGDISNDAKDVFKNWYANHKITVFFSEMSGDTRRLEFWKKYAHHFYRIEYLYDLIIIMESKQHLFVEFSDRASGKFYLYDIDELNIERVIKFSSTQSKTFVTDLLKNGYNYYKKEYYEQNLALVHRFHNWEGTFAKKLIYYDYEPR